MPVKLSRSVVRKMARLNRRLPLKQKRMVVGLTPAHHCVFNDLSTSYIIGGLPGQGKSTIAAWLGCMWVVLGGHIALIDPHLHHKEESLYARISPLQRWFVGPPVSFDEEEVDQALELLEWLWDEYNQRRHSMAGKQPLLVIIDEFNELLDELGKKEHEFACKVMRKLLRGGRKHGIVVCLIAQNWDLESTGGRAIRTTTGIKIVTPADASEYKLVLGLNDDQVKELPALTRGQAHVKKPGSKILTLLYPNTTQASCAAIAREVAHIEATYSSAETPPVVSFLPEPIRRITEPVVALVQPLETTHFEEEIITKIEDEKAKNTGISHLSMGDKRACGDVSSDKWERAAVPLDDKCISTEVQQEIIRMHVIERKSHGDISRKVKLAGRKYAAVYVPLYRRLGLSAHPDDVITPDEWQYLKQLHNSSCLACGRSEPGITLEKDRVLPGSKGGTYALRNVQPLCRSCNAAKGDRTIDYRTNAAPFVESR